MTTILQQAQFMQKDIKELHNVPINTIVKTVKKARKEGSFDVWDYVLEELVR